jgi:hypothetical protein
MMFLESMRLAARLPLAPTYLTSDKAIYVNKQALNIHKSSDFCAPVSGLLDHFVR